MKKCYSISRNIKRGGRGRPSAAAEAYMRIMNEGDQNVVFLDYHPKKSPNGLYMIMGGITYPSPDYCIIRTERSGIFAGGVYVLEYIKSGKGYIEADDGVYEVSGGDTVFMTAKQRITYYSDRADPYQKIWINFTGPLTAGMASGLSLDKRVYAIKYNSEPLIKEIHGLRAGINKSNRAESFDRMAVLILKILTTINRTVRAGNNAGARRSSAERAKEYIDEQLIPNLTLDDISNELRINKNYLIHSYKRRYGISPNQYIISKKIEHSKKMLLEKEMSISEISSVLNYSSTQHFSKAFKMAVGVSPGEYRKMTRDKVEIVK